MRIIGLTGGVGAGKSTVLGLLRERHHAYVIEADAVGRRLMKKGGITYVKILEAFGTDMLDADGEIHKGRLAAAAFGTEEATQRLNACTHPYIREAIAEEIIQAERTGAYELLVLEAAILAQGGLAQLCDAIWYVSVPQEVRIQRIMDSRGYTLERAADVIARQPSEAEYLALADAVIHNHGSLDETAAQVACLLASFEICQALHCQPGDLLEWKAD